MSETAAEPVADNPANVPAMQVTDASRISMSLPRLMLEVPAIPGYVLHWFSDRPGRIPRAVQGGYEFVKPDEVRVNNFGLAEDLMKDGNTDMGSRISIHGGIDEKGASERLYLMKIRQEWYDKDMALREQASDRIVQALRGGQVGLQGNMADVAHRYARGTDNLFTRKDKRRPA